jgi:hypothetical protein
VQDGVVVAYLKGVSNADGLDVGTEGTIIVGDRGGFRQTRRMRLIRWRREAYPLYAHDRVQQAVRPWLHGKRL